MLIFIGWLCTSVAVLPRLDVGLDQQLSMPQDSYVLKYFEAQIKSLKVGPPVYFVIKSNFNYSIKQELLCSHAGCSANTLTSILSRASKEPNATYIAAITPNSWIDDYYDWLGGSNNSKCCRLRNNNISDFCPSSVGKKYINNC